MNTIVAPVWVSGSSSKRTVPFQLSLELNVALPPSSCKIPFSSKSIATSSVILPVALTTVETKSALSAVGTTPWIYKVPLPVICAKISAFTYNLMSPVLLTLPKNSTSPALKYIWPEFVTILNVFLTSSVYLGLVVSWTLIVPELSTSLANSFVPYNFAIPAFLNEFALNIPPVLNTTLYIFNEPALYTASSLFWENTTFSKVTVANAEDISITDAFKVTPSSSTLFAPFIETLEIFNLVPSLSTTNIEWLSALMISITALSAPNVPTTFIVPTAVLPVLFFRI